MEATKELAKPDFFVVQMQNNMKNWHDNYQRYEKLVVVLDRIFKGLPISTRPDDGLRIPNISELPEDIFNPQSSDDGMNVNLFAKKLEDVALELGELAENMQVGTEVDEKWNGKEENCYKDHYDKMADLGHKPGDF